MTTGSISVGPPEKQPPGAPPSAILFDCWNTLFFHRAGSVGLGRAMHTYLGSKALRPVARRYEESLMRTPIDDVSEAAHRLLGALRIPRTRLTTRAMRSVLRASDGEATAFADTFPALGALRRRGILLGLVSNTTKLSFDVLVDRFNLLEHFDAVVLSYDVGLLKPDREIFHAALEKLDCAPAHAVMVGDSLDKDVRGAAGIGMEAVLLDRSERRRRHQPRISSLAELEPLYFSQAPTSR